MYNVRIAKQVVDFPYNMISSVKLLNASLNETAEGHVNRLLTEQESLLLSQGIRVTKAIAKYVLSNGICCVKYQ